MVLTQQRLDNLRAMAEQNKSTKGVTPTQIGQQPTKTKIGQTPFKVPILEQVSNFLYPQDSRITRLGGGLIAASGLAGKDIQQKGIETLDDLTATPKETLKTLGVTALEGFGLGVGKKIISGVTKPFASPISKLLASRAEKLYTRVLKPTAAELKKAPDVVKTGLNEGIRITEGGRQKVVNLIDDITDDIDKIIIDGAGKGKTVDADRLLSFSDEMVDYFKHVADDTDLAKKFTDNVVNSVKNLKNKFGKNIPIEDAQKIKRATQTEVRNAYQKLSSVSIEAKKSLAHGMKELIADAVPEVSKLNARDSKLLKLNAVLERSLGRLGNKEFLGLSDYVVLFGGLAKDGVGSSIQLTILKKILTNPGFRSSRAIIYNDLSKNIQRAISVGQIPAALTGLKILDWLDNKD